MSKHYPYLIGKTWKKSSRTLPVTNPHTQEVFANVSLVDTDEIRRAIGLASKAFEITRKQPSYLRARICSQIAEGIRKRRDEFAETISLESGKPLVFSKGEVDRSISTFTIASEEASRIHGEILNLDITETAQGKTGLTRRFPIGPIAAISPFNFPLNLVAHKVAPALATGNPILLKPSSLTPLTALLLGEVILDSDAADGSFSVLPCKSSEASPMIDDPRIKMISFTGSPPVGWDIKSRAEKKRVTLELGGNAGVIVEPDVDISHVAQRVCFGAFAYSGQVCISVQRTFVHETIFDAFVKALLEHTANLKRGNPLDDTTTIGPMIDLDNAERVEEWIQQALKNGAKCLAGGKRDDTFLEPTILTQVDPKLSISCQEAFGPVLIVEPYSDFYSAVDQINDSDFGLQAGIFTNQIDKAMRGFNRLEVGGVVLNDVPTFRVDNMPYGGIKDSGFGREGIRYSVEEMTELKLLVMNLYND